MTSLAFIAITAILLFGLGYRFYSKLFLKIFDIKDSRKTPAHEFQDGEDFIPTRPSMLLGQHFSAIAAVGPIAGPILAGIQYGWVMTLIWIIVGAVMIGAVHDMGAMFISVRHQGRSIGDIMKDYLGRRASLVFSGFIWFSLIYVITVFTDLTSSAFVNRPELGIENFGPGVATSSLLYLLLGILMGVCLIKFKMKLSYATALFVPLIFLIIWIGQKIPIFFNGDALDQQRIWNIIIIVYCFFASIVPMWLLLQPRGYLGGLILYATFIVGIFGILFGKIPSQFPPMKFTLGESPIPIFPLLFTTIACGACSGFHGLVSSGTTSKQIDKESHTRIVGYGGMILESLVAVIATATLMMLSPGDQILDLGPDEIYARGLAHFMEVIGIPFAAGVTFGKLAFATFIYDTLDVSTRLGRYVIQEITQLKGKMGAILSTLITLMIPVFIVFLRFHDANGNPIPLWKVVWPAFGASNQLLAALTLLSLTLWQKIEKRNWVIIGIPALLMTVFSYNSLLLILKKKWMAQSIGIFADPVGVTAMGLIILATWYIGQISIRFFRCHSERSKEFH
ncbi:MAG: carbon starvation protein A [Elusimicrobiota bacterium]